MKKVVLLTLMCMMMWNVKSYAGKGLCCCCDVDEDASLNRVPLIPNLGVKYIAKYEDFKQHFTADGDCEMRTSMVGTIPIKEELRAGRGQKTLVLENLDIWLKRVGPDIDILIQSQRRTGTVIRKGSIIDCEASDVYGRGTIYHPDGRSAYVKKY